MNFSTNPYKSPEAEPKKSLRANKSKGKVGVFEFEVDGKKLKAIGSSFSGKERVFIDDVLVSEKRSYAKNSRHNFKVGDKDYIVEFKLPNLLKAELFCNVYINEQLIAGKVATMNAKHLSEIIVPIILVFIAASVLGVNYFNISIWVLVLPGVIFFILSLVFINKYAFEIEDTYPGD